MSRYIFRSGSEFFEARLDGNNLYLKGRMTGDKEALFCEDMFKGDRQRMFKAKMTLNAMKGMNDRQKETYLIHEFLRMGYTLEKKM